MKRLLFSTVVAAAIGLTAAGCTNTPGSPTVSFTFPVAAGPSSGTSYKFKEQPVTLSIANAVRTATSPATYAVEVATDSGFASKVFTREGITEGATGSTSVTLSSLTASSGNVTYYWRSRATVDGATSPNSTTQSFVVQQQIVVNAPTLSEPEAGVISVESRFEFSTNNATRQGAVGTITYDFQVSKASDFSSIAASATVSEQTGGKTRWTPTADLPEGTLFWRVQAKDDTNAEVSAFTTPRSFVVEPFDPRKARFHHNLQDIGTWPQTAKITSVQFTRSGMLVEFDRRTGPNRWAEVAAADFGPLQYTLGLCYKIGGQWHCSASIQFWDGRDLSESGPWEDIPDNWYYDPARWGPMSGYRPKRGELVMVWAGQGNLRGTTGATQVQRTNFAPVKWGEEYIAK